MDIVQVILLTLVIQVASEYFISERTSKWREAVGKCDMAIPYLHPTEDGFSVNTDYDRSNGDVWLGYFMKMTAFDYIGCVRLDKQNFSQPDQRTSPGLCYTLCKGNRMIGVSIGKCICLDNLENLPKHEINCNTSCGSGVACGGDGYMSVYKVTATKNEITDAREKPCLSFEQYDYNKVRIFKWEKCSAYNPVVCKNADPEKGNSTSGTDTNTQGLTVRANRPWLNSMNECFQKGFLPMSYQALTDIKSLKTPFWSGVINSDVIYTYTEWNGNSEGVRFGYMSSNRRVYFTDTDSSRLILCKGTDPEKGNSTSGTDTNTQGQDVSVIIGVSVSASVVIIAVVAVLIILRRRGKIPNWRNLFKTTCCSVKDVMMKDEVDTASTVMKDNSPETVHSKQECNNVLPKTNDIINDHTYFELEPSNSHHDMPDINSHEKKQPKENNNIYNEIETESYTYAYVDKKKTSSLDDDYDTTETTAKNPKRKVDNINGDYAELENNTYNHIGGLPTSVSTDQTYNIPHHDDSQSKTDEGHDDQDTYSHINNKQSDGFSNNPDNVYNTTNAFKD